MLEDLQKLMILKLAKSLSMGDEGLLKQVIETVAYDSALQYRKIYDSTVDLGDYQEFENNIATVGDIVGRALQATGVNL